MTTIVWVLPLLMSLQAHAEVRIESNVAGAKIYDVSNLGERKYLGEAPYAVPGSNSGSYVIEMKGHVPVQIAVPEDISGTVVLKVQLKDAAEWLTSAQEVAVKERLEGALDSVLQIQSLLDQRQVRQAQQAAETLKSEFPSSVMARLLYANSLFIGGELQKAESIYVALLKEIPENRSVLKGAVQAVVDRMKRKVGK
jgi:hypothetical protein